jgi:hypothetical protein
VTAHDFAQNNPTYQAVFDTPLQSSLTQITGDSKYQGAPLIGVGQSPYSNYCANAISDADNPYNACTDSGDKCGVHFSMQPIFNPASGSATAAFCDYGHWGTATWAWWSGRWSRPTPTPYEWLNVDSMSKRAVRDQFARANVQIPPNFFSGGSTGYPCYEDVKASGMQLVVQVVGLQGEDFEANPSSFPQSDASTNGPPGLKSVPLHSTYRTSNQLVFNLGGSGGDGGGPRPFWDMGIYSPSANEMPVTIARCATGTLKVTPLPKGAEALVVHNGPPPITSAWVTLGYSLVNDCTFFTMPCNFALGSASITKLKDDTHGTIDLSGTNAFKFIVTN